MKSVLVLSLALVGVPVAAPVGAQTPCPLLAGVDVAHYLGGPATFGSSPVGRICGARRDDAIIKVQVQDDATVVATEAQRKRPFR